MVQDIEPIAIPMADKTSFAVLIVDDEPVLAKMVMGMLTKAGYTCEVAHSAASALEVFKAKELGLVITDIRMPEIDGVTLAEQIGAIKPDFNIIFMTAFVEDEVLLRAIKTQPFGFLEKPFHPEQLLSLVERAFSAWRVRLEVAQQQEYLIYAIEQKTKDLAFQNERLMAEKELMHGLISQGNFGLIALDTSGNIHLINEYAGNILGIQPDHTAAALMLPLHQLLPEDIKAPVTTLYEQVLRENALHDLDQIKAGSGRELNIIAYPVRYKEKTIAVVIIIHDITDNQTLQRTLLQASKLASIGELAAGVAHEINNPLGFITSNCNRLSEYTQKLIGYIGAVNTKITAATDGASLVDLKSFIAERMEQDDINYISSDTKDLVVETLDGLVRVSKIVRDLKMFARADAEMPEKARINDLLNDALNLVRNEVKYNLDVVTDYAELPEIVCHPSQLVQVFTNIFINAAHAAKKHGALTIKTRQNDDSIQIMIRDDGVGIPEKILPKIFDPFFTTKEPGKGTGMGLSISYGIIEKHRGSITATSEEGVGTEFTITLPVNSASTADQEAKLAAKE